MEDELTYIKGTLKEIKTKTKEEMQNKCIQIAKKLKCSVKELYPIENLEEYPKYIILNDKLYRVCIEEKIKYLETFFKAQKNKKGFSFEIFFEHEVEPLGIAIETAVDLHIWEKKKNNIKGI